MLLSRGDFVRFRRTGDSRLRGNDVGGVRDMMGGGVGYDVVGRGYDVVGCG